ncbi:MAG TPA: YdcF family protein [Candidatus Xenobia bacterium]
MSRRRWLLLSALVVLAAALLPIGWITWLGDLPPAAAADCIIVPGALTDAQGHLGRCLTARTHHAIELYDEHLAPNIIFTGGRGVEGSIESESARQVAIKAGLPPDHLFTEDLSHDTRGNFRQAAAIMAAHHWQTCIISTDPFHTRRCLRLADDFHLVATVSPVWKSPAWTSPRLWMYYTGRECAAWVKYGMVEIGIYPAFEDHA